MATSHLLAPPRPLHTQHRFVCARKIYFAVRIPRVFRMCASRSLRNRGGVRHDDTIIAWRRQSPPESRWVYMKKEPRSSHPAHARSVRPRAARARVKRKQRNPLAWVGSESTIHAVTLYAQACAATCLHKPSRQE